VLWHCWLGDRKGIRPVKKWVVGCWHGYLSGARCRLAYGPADATATHCFLLQWNPDCFTFLVPAHPGSPRQRAVKRVCVILTNSYSVPPIEWTLVSALVSEDGKHCRDWWCDGRYTVSLLVWILSLLFISIGQLQFCELMMCLQHAAWWMSSLLATSSWLMSLCLHLPAVCDPCCLYWWLNRTSQPVGNARLRTVATTSVSTAIFPAELRIALYHWVISK